MQKNCFCDTNVLMQFSGDIFATYEKVFLCGYVLQELDKHKTSSDDNKKFQAREATRNIINNENKVEYVIKEGSSCLPTYFDNSSMDNKIISVFMDLLPEQNDIIGLSNDLLFLQKCKLLGLPCEMFGFSEKCEVEYKGYKQVILDNYAMSLHYQCPINKWDLKNNEYLIIRDEDYNVVDKQKWVDGKGFVSLKYSHIDNAFCGKIKPRNTQQELAFDLFQNKNIAIKCIFGKHGSGKDLIMSSHAISMVQKGVYDKLLFVRNNYGVKNSKDIGFLPGTQEEKLMPFVMPLADHLGGISGLKMFIDQGKIELQHLGFIRGRDIKNSIIYCTEAENMTKEHIQLLISRLAEGSTIWLNGDFKQVDDNLFERNSGMKQMINALMGQELFGCVELSTTERSKAAQLADLLD